MRVPHPNYRTRHRIGQVAKGGVTAALACWVVGSHYRNAGDNSEHDNRRHESDSVSAPFQNILMRLLAVSKLSLEASRRVVPLPQPHESGKGTTWQDKSTSVKVIEYDFIVLGHGNAGKSAVETLKDQCPGATIALVDPIRSLQSNDSNLQSYRQPALGFHPPSRTVKMADPTFQLKYRHAILVATGTRGAPPPLPLFDQEVLNRVLELRPTEALGNGTRPVLPPETIRELSLMAAAQGAKVCVLGSGWEAIELGAAAAKAGTEMPMIVFGSAGPLSNVLPRYLSTAVTKRLRQEGLDVQERSLVRYVSHHASPLTNVTRMEVHIAKSFDFLDTSRKLVDLLVVAPLVDGARGTAVLPTLDVPATLENHRMGRTWYQSWSQLSSPPTEPSTIVCFADDGRMAVNAELNAASKVYAAGSVAKYPNSITGHTHVAGQGPVDAALAGRLAALHMARDYHERTLSAKCADNHSASDPASFASSSFPIFRSDITPYNLAEGNQSSLSTVGINALVVGRCDSETMSTHGFWWTNTAENRTSSGDETTKIRSKRTKRSQSPVYGIGLVFYMDRTGRIAGIMSWGLPFAETNSLELNQALVNRMIDVINSNGGISHGVSDGNLLLTTNHLAEESKRLTQLAIEGKRIKGMHRRLTNKIVQLSKPLYRYTAAKPSSVTSMGLLKRKDHSASSELVGENMYIKTDDIYSAVASNTRPPSLVYVYPMHTATWRGDDDQDKWKDPYILSDIERIEQAWNDNERRARPAKEEPLWLRRDDARRGTNYVQVMKDMFLSNMRSGRFADGSEPLQRVRFLRTVEETTTDASRNGVHQSDVDAKGGDT